MKTKIITSIALIMLAVLSVRGQAKKEETTVMNFPSYRLWVPGLDEYVKGAFRIEQTVSENLDEFIAIGTGLGLSSQLIYEVRSDYSTKIHGDGKSATFNQVMFIRLDGKLIIKIMRLYQIKIDEMGMQTITVEKDELFDYR